MQRGAGFTVTSSSPRAVEGAELIIRARFGPVRMTASTRVVYVVGDETWAEVRAFSWPGRWYTRLGGPVVRRLQHRVTQRYLDAVTKAVE